MYAFARDGGMPFSRKIKEVSKLHKTPVTAIWLTVACAFIVSIYSEAYAAVTAISVISLYFSYIAPVYLSWRGRYVTPLVKGPWHLGKHSHTINFLAIAWTVFISVIVSIANDMIAGKTMVVLGVVLALWYHFRERHVFTGPSWIGAGLAEPAESDQP